MSEKIIDNGNGSKSILIDLNESKCSSSNPEGLMLANGSSKYMPFSRDDLFSFSSQLSPRAKGFRICGGNEALIKEKIYKAIFYWEKDPVVYRCVSLLAELANDTFTISCEDKALEKELNLWWKKIRGEEFLSHFFLEYFRSCNVPIIKTSIQYNGEIVPASYTILNPLNIKIKETNIPGIKQFFLNIDNNFVEILKGKDQKNIDKIKMVFPEEIIQMILQNKTEVPLSSDSFSFITKDKQPYEEWALPIISHAFDALDYRRDLMEMDRSTVKGIRGRILKVTIGNDNFPVTDSAELALLAEKFTGDPRSGDLTLFWNHTLEIEYIEPNLDSLFVDKYEPALDDIRSVFGVSKVLLGQSGDSSGNNALCLKGMMEILDGARKSFLGWFYDEINTVANLIGNKNGNEVTVDFRALSLKDENEFFKVVMQMVDRQVISYETAMETMGHYFPKEIQRLKSEKKIREKDGILVAQSAPTQGGGEKAVNDQGGRPSGVKETSRPKSKDKPKRPSGVKVTG